MESSLKDSLGIILIIIKEWNRPIIGEKYPQNETIFLRSLSYVYGNYLSRNFINYEFEKYKLITNIWWFNSEDINWLSNTNGETKRFNYWLWIIYNEWFI